MKMTFHRCLLFLIAATTVSSFAPSVSTKGRPDRTDGQNHDYDYQASSFLMASLNDGTGAMDEPIEERNSRSRRNKSVSLFQRLYEERSVSTAGSGILATSMVVGSLLFVSPDPAAAMTVDVPQPPAKTGESTPPMALSPSSLTISDFLSPNELRIQPKYLDLAGDLKEELKFRAQQAKEKSAEVAKEAIEKQKAEAAKREAKLKEYDDMFDQAEKERNEYFSKRIISRDAYLQNVKEQQATQDRSEYNKVMTALAPDASPVEELKYKLEKNIEEENRLKKALAENNEKDPNDRDTKIEKSLLKISIEKAELQTSKIRKDIALEESLESIRLQRQAEIKVYQERAEVREREKQEKIEQIRLAKEKEREEFLEIRARKRQEVEDLKFDNAQIIFERKFDDLDRFERRKGILESAEKKQQAARVKGLVNELNQLAVEGSKTGAEEKQMSKP